MSHYIETIQLLGITQENQKHTCTQMFAAALFIITQNGRQPKWPPDKRLNKTWYFHKIEYYLAIKKE